MILIHLEPTFEEIFCPHELNCFPPWLYEIKRQNYKIQQVIIVAVFLKYKSWIVITKLNTEKVLNSRTVSGELVLYNNVDHVSFSLTNGAGLS